MTGVNCQPVSSAITGCYQFDNVGIQLPVHMYEDMFGVIESRPQLEVGGAAEVIVVRHSGLGGSLSLLPQFIRRRIALARDDARVVASDSIAYMKFERKRLFRKRFLSRYVCGSRRQRDQNRTDISDAFITSSHVRFIFEDVIPRVPSDLF